MVDDYSNIRYWKINLINGYFNLKRINNED